MKITAIVSILTLVGSCATTKYSTKIQTLKDNIKITDSASVMEYAHTIKASELKDLLYIYAGPEFEGRATGEKGQKDAANFLKSYYQAQDISSAIKDSICFLYIPKSYFIKEMEASKNVLAFMLGKEKAEAVLIVVANYDHYSYKKSL